MHVYIDHLYTSEGRLYISYSTLSHTLKAGAAFQLCRLVAEAAVRCLAHQAPGAALRSVLRSHYIGAAG